MGDGLRDAGADPFAARCAGSPETSFLRMKDALIVVGQPTEAPSAVRLSVSRLVGTPGFEPGTP